VVRLGFPSSFVHGRLKAYFKEFCDKYPNISFKFFDKGSEDLLEKRQLDLVVRAENYLKGAGFDTIELFEHDVIFIATEGFLKKNNLGTTIKKEQLCKLPIISRHDFAKEFEKKAGRKALMRMTTMTNGTTLAMAQNGLGIGCYYGDPVADRLCDVVKVSIKDLEFQPKKILVAYNDGQITKATRAFLDGLVEFCGR